MVAEPRPGRNRPSARLNPGLLLLGVLRASRPKLEHPSSLRRRWKELKNEIKRSFLVESVVPEELLVVELREHAPTLMSSCPSARLQV